MLFLAVPLFALAWAAKGELGGQSAALALSALACVTLGWLLVSVVPARWVKLGIYAMAIVDAYLVFTELLQEPNRVLNAAAPALDLPKLQLVDWGSALMGFGDLFIAAVLGALLARDRTLQLRGALLAATLCCAWDLLFFAVKTTPATVPVALTLLTLELWGRGARARRPLDKLRRDKGRPALQSADHRHTQYRRWAITTFCCTENRRSLLCSFDTVLDPGPAKR